MDTPGSAQDQFPADNSPVPSGRLDAVAGLAEIGEMTAEQDRDAAAFAAEFLKKVIRIRGVRIERGEFLRQELRKHGVSDATIAAAVAATPEEAGVELRVLDELATSAIAFETSKSAAMSFAAGLPGGFAMLASVPADITQYYVHAFRVMQKLAYLYGWQNFIDDLDDVDDETLGKLGLFLGVMMGVGGASASLTQFAQRIARPALQKQIAKQALTKTAWYGPLKQTLSMIGVKLTKDSFAKAVTKAVPVAGGIISGGMTLVSLRMQAERLQAHLRELPAPGVDAAAHRRAVDEAGSGTGKTLAARDAVGSAVSGALTGAQGVAGSARDAASGAASRAKGLAGSVFKRRREQDDVAEPSSPADSSDLDAGAEVVPDDAD